MRATFILELGDFTSFLDARCDVRAAYVARRNAARLGRKARAEPIARAATATTFRRSCAYTRAVGAATRPEPG